MCFSWDFGQTPDRRAQTRTSVNSDRDTDSLCVAKFFWASAWCIFSLLSCVLITSGSLSPHSHRKGYKKHHNKFRSFLHLDSENWEDQALCFAHVCSTWLGPEETGRCWRGRCNIRLYPGNGSCSASPHPLRPEHYLWPTARRILMGQQRGTNIDFVFWFHCNSENSETY